MAGFVFNGNWAGLEFPKYGKEIIAQAEKKVALIKAKIEERQERIKTITEQKKINISDVLSNMDDLNLGNTSYKNHSLGGGFNMTVGEAEQLKAEARCIKEEKASLEHLMLIVRNLPKEQVFKLNFQQLEYLDF